MKVLKMADLDLTGKRVLIREDLNVPVQDNLVTSDARIRAWVAPLDEFSFPSGHTLHAVAFSLVALAHYPVLAWLLIPFTASVAVSRVVLGLHYPSDVLAATGIGAALASFSLWLVPGVSLFG